MVSDLLKTNQYKIYTMGKKIKNSKELKSIDGICLICSRNVANLVLKSSNL
jgi:hypothetical protein